MPEIVRLMYRNSKNKRARFKMIATLCIDNEGIHAIEHVSKHWVDFCKTNILTDETFVDKFINDFIDEFYENPMNSRYGLSHFDIYNLYSE